MSTIGREWVQHPGHYIREEMDARGWIQRDLAFILQCPEQSINLILQGKRGISSDMAKSLGKAFDVPPEFFTNLQNAFDLSRAQEPSPAVAVRARLQAVYPVREMIKRGWIEDGAIDILQFQLCRFFDVANVDEIPYLAHSAKKQSYVEREIPPLQLAWLFRAKQLAGDMAATQYSKQKLVAGIAKLLPLLTEPESTRYVPAIIAECGVRLVFVEPLPGAKIDGVCFWLGDSPVVGMSLRFDRIDNFWFVLRHELEHVLHGHGKDVEVIDCDLGTQTSTSEEERIANDAAAEFCTPTGQVDNFILRKMPFISERDVLALSARLNRHPGLVVGQIQKKLDRHDFLKRHQVKFRSFILPSAITDGWGLLAPLSS